MYEQEKQIAEPQEYTRAGARQHMCYLACKEGSGFPIAYGYAVTSARKKSGTAIRFQNSTELQPAEEYRQTWITSVFGAFA